VININEINEFETEYMKLYWKSREYQMSNYFENTNYDLTIIDNQIFELASKYRKLIKVYDRKTELASLLIERDIIEKSLEVSKLRNKIDNPDNYNHLISDEIKNDKNQYKLTLSSVMKNDVIDLIKLRDDLSKKAGYSSYSALILRVEELDRKNLINLLNNYLDNNLNMAIKIIDKYNIKLESWFSDIKKINLNIPMVNVNQLINQFLEKLGLSDIKDNLKITFLDQGIAGYASEVAPSDLRIFLSPITTLFDLNTLFHELGHAISYHFNQEKGLYKILPNSYDEAMAVVIEHIAANILFDRKIKEKFEEIEILEYTRCAISALFEFELLENPQQAEELYIKYYSKLNLKINNPSLWSLDSFRSIDPVYIGNYVIGAELSREIINYLHTNYSSNYKEWGKYLINNIYFDGRKRPFKEKIKNIYKI